jgi:hypothetical protein
MFNEIAVMDELDKFFEDDEKSKKRYKLLLSLKISTKYLGKNIIISEPKKKETKKKIIKIHRKSKGKDNDNIF